jgi:tetratricopeptide (TPR) repeat protein
MQSVNHIPREESQMKLARVDRDQVSASYEYVTTGMHVFRELFPAEGDEPESVRSAITLYNVGQTQVGLGQYKKAMKWFKLARLRLKLGTSRASTLYVHAIHNVGYCHYRLGDSEGAKNCFVTALGLARLAGLEKRGIDSINNSLGVLCSDKWDMPCFCVRSEEVVSVRGSDNFR